MQDSLYVAQTLLICLKSETPTVWNLIIWHFQQSSIKTGVTDWASEMGQMWQHPPNQTILSGTKSPSHVTSVHHFLILWSEVLISKILFNLNFEYLYPFNYNNGVKGELSC